MDTIAPLKYEQSGPIYRQTKDGFEENYKNLVDNIKLGIYKITSDINGKFIEVNPAMEKITGYSKKELLNMTISDLYFYTAERAVFFKEITSSRCKVTKEINFKKKNGIKILVSNIEIPIKLNNKIIHIDGIIEDITEYNQTKEILHQKINELENVTNELEEYLSIISHDLTSPLYSIQAFTNFLIDDYGDKFDEKGKEYFKRLESNSLRAQQLINDLLIFSQVGRKDTIIEIVNLNQIIDEIKDDLKEQINATDTNLFVQKLPTILTQRVWIKQLFKNLIDNAIRFNDSKPPQIDIEYEEKEDRYLFKIKDNGIGMEERHLIKIFNIFERLHPQTKYGGGTGAGLAICKKIVKTLGGKIWVQSKMNEGSIFYFDIIRVGRKEI